VLSGFSHDIVVSCRVCGSTSRRWGAVRCRLSVLVGLGKDAAMQEVPAWWRSASRVARVVALGMVKPHWARRVRHAQ